MLIGLNTQKSAGTTGTASANGDIFDVTSKNFELAALKESMKRPILVEFWAPWCGPCKQLMPILESLVTSKKGQIAMAKVNIDEEPELAQAFRVQSVPMVVALYQGQPVTGFAGVRPQSDIEKLVEQLIALHHQNQPEALDIPQALKDAANLLAEGELPDAQDLYARILEQDHTQVDAYVGLVRVVIAAGDLEQAATLIGNAPDLIAKDAKFAAAKTAYHLALDAPKGDIALAEAAVAKDPRNCTLLYELAGLYFAKNEKQKASDALLTILKMDRGWENEKARKQLLTYLEAWGFADPVSVQARRKLSTLLFS